MWIIRKSASPRKVKGQTDHGVEAVSMALIKKMQAIQAKAVRMRHI